MKRLALMDIVAHVRKLVGSSDICVEADADDGRVQLLLELPRETVSLHLRTEDLDASLDEFTERWIRPALMADMTCLSCGAQVSGGALPCGH